MSVYTKVSDFISPIAFQTSLRTLNNAQSIQYSLINELSNPNLSPHEKMKRLSLALLRDAVLFLNVWDLRDIIDESLIRQIIQNVPYFRKLSISTFKTRKFVDEICKKHIEDLTIYTSSNQRINDAAVACIIAGSRNLLRLKLSLLNLNSSLSSRTLVELDVCCPGMENSFDLSNFPSLKVFKIEFFLVRQSVFNITLPKFHHPIEVLKLMGGIVKPVDPEFHNYFSFLECLRLISLSVIDNSQFVNFLIDIVLDNEGEISLDVPSQWNYFKDGDRLKKFSLFSRPGQQKVTYAPTFPECEIMELSLTDEFSLEKLPKNLKELTLNLSGCERIQIPKIPKNLTELKILKIINPPSLSGFFLNIEIPPKIEKMILETSKNTDAFFCLNTGLISCPVEINFLGTDGCNMSVVKKLSHPIKINGLIKSLEFPSHLERHFFEMVDCGTKQKIAERTNHFSRMDCKRIFYTTIDNSVSFEAINDEWIFFVDEIIFKRCKILSFASFSNIKNLRFEECEFDQDTIGEIEKQLKIQNVIGIKKGIEYNLTGFCGKIGEYETIKMTC
jgi:hypothetical protein